MSATAAALLENSVMRAMCNTRLMAQAKQSARERLVLEGEELPGNSRDLIAAAGTLECWLVTTKGEQRKIETIPPQDLDQYLVEFFSLLKRRDGRDFDPSGFGKYRSAMDNFLSRKKYPVSIRRSELFLRSQMIFKWRVKELSQSLHGLLKSP